MTGGGVRVLRSGAGIAAVPTRAAPRPAPTPGRRSGSAAAGQVGKVVAGPARSVHPASPRPAPSPRAPGPQSRGPPAAHLRPPRSPSRSRSRLANLGPSWGEGGGGFGERRRLPASSRRGARGERGPPRPRGVPPGSVPTKCRRKRRGGGNFLPSRHAGCQVQPLPLGLLLAAAPGPAPRPPQLAARPAPSPARPLRAALATRPPARPRHSPPARARPRRWPLGAQVTDLHPRPGSRSLPRAGAPTCPASPRAEGDKKKKKKKKGTDCPGGGLLARRGGGCALRRGAGWGGVGGTRRRPRQHKFLLSLQLSRLQGWPPVFVVVLERSRGFVEEG